jgi:hypothetical protein
MQRRIQRSLFDVQYAAGPLLNPIHDGVPMHGSVVEHVQNQHFERSLEEVAFLLFHGACYPPV